MQYFSENAYPNIILYKCITDKAELKDGNLTLEFSDGFWVSEEHPDNPYDRLLKTCESKMIIYGVGEEFSWIKIYKKSNILPMVNITKLSIDEFVKNINSSKWKLEFLDENYKDNQILYLGNIKDKSYGNLEGTIRFDYDKIEYMWDELYPERTWNPLG